MSAIPPIKAAATLPAPPADKPTNLEQAAQSFEALLVGQMLKMVRESSQSGGLGESDSAGSSVYEMAEENLARELTRNGGLGLAKLIVRQLSPVQTGPSSVTAPSSHSEKA